MKKKIALALVPLFALSACSSDIDSNSSGVASTNQTEVTQNDEGFYQNQLMNSYSDAVKNGYTGSFDDWIALVKLNETNPTAANEQAAASGFSGGEVLLGAIAGAAVGAMAASAMNNRSNMSNNSYSAQRSNNSNNYAYSQPLNRQEERRNSSGGVTSAAMVNSNSRPTSNVTSSNNRQVTRTTAARSTTTVSRGGFGGAVSSGG